MTIYAGTPIYPGRLGTVIEIEPAENIGVPIYPGRLGTVIEIRPARNIGVPVNPGRLGTVIEIDPSTRPGGLVVGLRIGGTGWSVTCPEPAPAHTFPFHLRGIS